MKNLNNIFSLFLFFFLPFSLMAANVSNISELAEMEQSIDDMQNTLESAEGKYLSPLIVKSEISESFSQKLKRGDYFFSKKDFSISGSIYYSIFSAKKDKDFVWEEALFKLSESLFLNKNYISAVRYYEMLLTSIPGTRYQIEILKRLITASYYLGEYSKAKNYYAEFMGIGYDISKDDELVYFLGKSLFFDNQYSESAAIFETVKTDTIYYPQSLYFLGVISIQQNNFQKAEEFFKKVITQKNGGKYYKFIQVYDLSMLALGRISFEKGNYNDSIDYYLKLSKGSSYFSQSYYELCWTYIKKGEYAKALDAIRLLKIIDPESILSPKADVLEGNLLIKMKKYGDAMIALDNIVKKYGAINNRLSQFEGKKSDKGLSDIFASENSFSLFPPMVKSLLKDNKKFLYSSRLDSDIKEIQGELDEIEKIEHKINAIITSKNAAVIFKPLKAASEMSVALQNRLLNFKSRLMDIRKEITWNSLSSDQKNRIRDLDNEKKSLDAKLIGTPITEAGLKEESSKYAKKIMEVEEELHLISIQIKTAQEQITAVNTYYLKNKGDQKDPELLFQRRIEAEKNNLSGLLTSLNEYKKEIEQEKNNLILGGEVISMMIIARSKYKRLFSEQSEIYDSISPSFNEKAQRIKNLEQTISVMDARVNTFFLKLNEVVSGIVGNIKQSYEEEAMKVDEYKTQLVVLRNETLELVNSSMLSNIGRVRFVFNDIVLQADLGILDVAWERKQEASDNLIKYRTEMAKEIQSLYQNLENIE